MSDTPLFAKLKIPGGGNVADATDVEYDADNSVAEEIVARAAAVPGQIDTHFRGSMPERMRGAKIIRDQKFLTSNISGATRYKKLGSVPGTNGHLTVKGILFGHTAAQGRSSVDLVFSTRGGLEVTGSLFGNVGSAWLEVRANGYDVDESAPHDYDIDVYLATQSFTNVDLLEVSGSGGGSIYDNGDNDTWETTEPAKPLVWDLRDHDPGDGVKNLAGVVTTPNVYTSVFPDTGSLWTAANDCNVTLESGGGMRITGTGPDPRVDANLVLADYSGAANPLVFVTMTRVVAGDEGAVAPVLYWATDSRNFWSVNHNTTPLAGPADLAVGATATYVFDIRQHPEWADYSGGTITNLRLDPMQTAAGLVAGTVVVDRIEVGSNRISAEVGNEVLDLASTENGKGAALIGVEDSGSDFVSTTVEGALTEARLNGLISGGTVAASSGVITVAPQRLYTLTAGDAITGVDGLADGQSFRFVLPDTGSDITLTDAGSPASGQPLSLAVSTRTLRPGTDKGIYCLTRVGSRIVMSGAGSSSTGAMTIDASTAGLAPGTNITAALNALRAQGYERIGLPRGTYDIDIGGLNPIDYTLEGDGDQTVLRMANPVAGTTADMLPLAQGARISKLCLDGNKAGNIGSYNFASTQYNGWRGIQTFNGDVHVEDILLRNFISSPMFLSGDKVTAKRIRAEGCASGIYFGFIGRSYKDYMIEDISNIDMDSRLTGQAGTGTITPHAIDFFGLVNSSIEKILVRNMDGGAHTVDSISPQLSGITVAGCKDTTFVDLAAEEFYGTANGAIPMQHAVITIPYNQDCQFDNLRARKFNGAGVEATGCENVIITNAMVDGEYHTPNACTMANSYAFSNEQRSFDWGNEIFHHFAGGSGVKLADSTLKGCGYGAYLFGGVTDIRDCNLVNNYYNGIRTFKISGTNLNNGSGDGIDNKVRVRGGLIARNGGAGIANNFGDIDLGGGVTIVDNNLRSLATAQLTTDATDLKASHTVNIDDTVFEWTVHLDSSKSPTPITLADAVSFAPQTAVLAPDTADVLGGSPVYVADVRLLLPTVSFWGVILEEGMQVTIAGQTGFILSENQGDMKIAFPSAVSLAVSGSMLTSMGTVTSQSAPDSFGHVTLTGSGTSWVGAFALGEWVTDGTEYRRLVRVDSNTSLTVDEAFTTTPTSISKVTADAVTVPPTSLLAMDFASAGSVTIGSGVRYRGYRNAKKMNYLTFNLFREGSYIYVDNTVTAAGVTTIDADNLTIGPHHLISYRAIIEETVSGASSALLALNDQAGNFYRFEFTTDLTKNSQMYSFNPYISSNSVDPDQKFPNGDNMIYQVQFAGNDGVTGSMRWERYIRLDTLPGFTDIP